MINLTQDILDNLYADLDRAEAEASRLGGVEGLYMEAADRATVAEAQLARISSLVRVLYPQEMTPTAKRMLDRVLSGEIHDE